MDDLSRQRLVMITDHLLARGIVDEDVLEAMRSVPRHRFVPAGARAYAYADHPVPLAHGATVSQPYIVALMTQLACVAAGERVLEVGTGSGYQAAVLAALGAEVYSIEVVAELAVAAERTLTELGYNGVRVRHGDGHRGWPEHAPYAAILVTAAAPILPKPLTDQLAVGGRLVIPVGRGAQDLQVLERREHDLRATSVLPVQFVPMTGDVEVEASSRRP
ncbi:MAG: protein-L-isoaspartate(D-aspartate) O-methyltransferase [Myxococcales bacterium]|nr:protein-L-isoaspartate(D-aspartate) O-methyltransferase [Myxococcales bacterium]